MSHAKNYVIALLVATTLGGALLAWRQYSDLVELRAAAMNRDERADLQKRVWALEKLNRELQAQRSSGQTPTTSGEAAAANDTERPAGDRRDGPGRGGRGGPPSMQQVAAIRELMNKPEVQAMMSLQQRAGIEQRYASLFRNLSLPPEQVEKLTSLLAERMTTMQDVMSAAHDQGINPRDNPESFRKMIADAQGQINDSIKATIGESGFAQLSNYEQTMPQRNVVNELQQRLSYTSTPLSGAQAEQLVQILASTSPTPTDRPTNADTPRPPDRGPGFGPPGGRGGPDIGGLVAGMVMGGGPPDGGRGPTATVTPAAVAQSQTVLTPPQVTALQQIQQQQQAQQQLRQMVNQAITNNPPTTSGATNSSNPPARKRPGGG